MEVLEASRLATTGGRTEAINRLRGLVGNPDHRIAAHAAYTLGRIYQEDNLFTNAISAYQRALDFGPLTGVAEDAARNLQLTIDSMQAHYGEGSATDAGHQWLEHIKHGRMKDAWKGIDRTTRLVLTQAWIVANERHPTLGGIDRDFLAQELAKAEPTHRLTAAFFATQLDELQNSYSAYDPETWGAAERPRPYGVDYEAVIMAETSGEPFMWEDGQELQTIFLLLRRRFTRWYIASFRAEILNPGWPPTSTPIDIQNITWRVPDSQDR
ncbi:tetratricopeptide repeat protein [Micromonospora sp. WMMD735]|uniref:tetratricopeptide repeat protein n=1 Tax=Micromonospora sp. WMMD735 TaxID=3404130 RepID=UPI003B94B90B